ncbi:MAG: magnesium transporter CorA family protein [Patescibacteria group bacterium]|nr:magnesium transporter CorA family protein [Patescibacteria group bacterium]
MIKIFSDKLKKLIESNHPKTDEIWIHGENLNEFEIDQFVEVFHVDKDLVRDAHDSNEVPRLEFQDETPYLFLRYPHNDDQIQTYPLLCIIQPNRLITISKHPFPFSNAVIKRVLDSQKINAHHVLFCLLMEINSAYNMSLTSISRDIRRYQKREGVIKNADILRFVHIENTLYDLSTSLSHMDTLYGILKNYEMFASNEEERDIFEDIRLEGEQMEQLMKVNIRTITNIRDAYTIILSNNLNRTIKMFTSFTVILTIPILIASFYGMNVQLPFQDHPFAFSGILFLSFFFVFVMTYTFAKKDWI